jgi:hypothetical protein
MSEIIWFLVGLGFGIIIMLNRKEHRDQKTVEQVDVELRNDLALNKNLVKSLKDDVSFLKSRLQTLKEQNDNSKRTN